MNREIAVAGVEPGGFAELSHGLQAKKSIALHPPAALPAQQAGEHISNGINIGRNVQSPPEQVVAGVDDHGDFLRRDHLLQTVNKLGASCAPGEHADHAALASLARPSRSRAAASFCASSPGLDMTVGRNSGYTGKR